MFAINDSKRNSWRSLGPQVPMKNEGLLHPQYMGEITPKNEGTVCSHGLY